jgi:hypothetical protein
MPRAAEGTELLNASCAKLNCGIWADSLLYSTPAWKWLCSFMSGIGFVSITFGIAALVAVVSVMLTFDAESWISRDLKRGDLYALIDVASGLRPDGLTRDQASRLAARGMVHAYGAGNYRATIKGRVALRIRQAVRQTVQS